MRLSTLSIPQGGLKVLTTSHYVWILTGLAAALSLCSLSFAGEVIADSAAARARQEMRKHISAIKIDFTEDFFGEKWC